MVQKHWLVQRCLKLNSTANVDLTAPPFNVPIPGASASTPVQTEIRVRISALAPRLTFMSTEQWLGATVGATALLPLIEKKRVGRDSCKTQQKQT